LSSVWVGTLDWLGTVVRGATDATPRFATAGVCLAASTPSGHRAAAAIDWVRWLAGAREISFGYAKRKGRAWPEVPEYPSRDLYGALLLADTCAPEFTKSGGFGQGSSPVPPSPH
jgi:hypothetical protein